MKKSRLKRFGDLALSFRPHLFFLIPSTAAQARQYTFFSSSKTDTTLTERVLAASAEKGRKKHRDPANSQHPFSFRLRLEAPSLPFDLSNIFHLFSHM